MKLILNDRSVDITDFKFELGEGFSVISANYLDEAGEDLSDRECQDLEQKYQSELYQEAYENMASEAYDRAKDRRKYGED